MKVTLSSRTVSIPEGGECARAGGAAERAPLRPRRRSRAPGLRAGRPAGPGRHFVGARASGRCPPSPPGRPARQATLRALAVGTSLTARPPRPPFPARLPAPSRAAAAVTVTVKARTVTVTGKNSEGKSSTLVRAFKGNSFSATVDKSGRELKVDMWFGNRLQIATLRTICTHIENMIKGQCSCGPRRRAGWLARRPSAAGAAGMCGG
jgi:hypothetical protein